MVSTCGWIGKCECFVEMHSILCGGSLLFHLNEHPVCYYSPVLCFFIFLFLFY